MGIKRRHFFEFNDSRHVPEFLSESIVEILGKTVISANIYQPAVPVFQAFCEKAQCSHILDLCSGSGEATSLLIDSANTNAETELHCFLSDLNPIQPTIEGSESLPSAVSRLPKPVDALNIDVSDTPPHQARTLIAGFHHFKPKEAKAFLEAAVRDEKSIFILEPFPRQLRRTLPFFIYSFLPGALNPLRTKKQRLLKALFTYLLPIIPFLGWWDTLVSALRMYSENEYMDMVSDVNGYHWEYQALANPLWGEVTVFTGIPIDNDPS